MYGADTYNRGFSQVPARSTAGRSPQRLKIGFLPFLSQIASLLFGNDSGIATLGLSRHDAKD